MEVGEYVRTNNGLIFKIVGGNEDNWELDIEYSKLEYMEDTWLELYKYNDNGGWFIKENCKSSPNIIDLIEVGDYVNGHRVNFIDGDREYFVISFGNDAYTLKSQFNDDIYWLAKDDIKSIVTKEQFEAMKYEIE